MIRTKINYNFDKFIITSDWHLREPNANPVCRTDNFYETQWKKIAFIKRIQAENGMCPIIHAGDLFHHWKPSPELLSKTIINLPKNFYTIYGNHDLPQHSLELLHKSGIHTLRVAGALTVISTGHFGSEDIGELNNNVGIWHKFVYKKGSDEEGWAVKNNSTILAENVLQKYPKYDIIITGDNHSAFVVKRQDESGKIHYLINPGSLTRQTAMQEDFQPRIYIYDKNRKKKLEKIYIPIVKSAVSREHLDEKQERAEALEVFINQLKQEHEWMKSLDFKQNIEMYMQSNKVNKAVRALVYAALEE